MFAMAIWDARDRSCVLARDRFGIKPLYYHCDGARLTFASEVKALLASGVVPSDIDPQGAFGYFLTGTVPEPHTLLREVKEREAQGYAYEGADASFELLARRTFETVPHYFDVQSYRVMVEQRHNALGELVTVSEAVVKVAVDGEIILSAGEGNGPVNALDVALRKDLGKYQSFIDDLELVDYKVRILNGGTGATTRVLIESRDRAGSHWFTVGVSPNIVDASFEALLDSINYKLIRDGAPAP